jgi:hypothetical protein
MSRASLLAFIMVTLLAAHAHAEVVECDDTRVGCEDALLLACPDGATVLDEQLTMRRPTDGGAAHKHYRLSYACGTNVRGESAAPAADENTVPAPAPTTPQEPFKGFQTPMEGRLAKPPARAAARSSDHQRGMLELRQLDLRIEELADQRRSHDLVAPIVLTAGTGIAAATFFSFALIASTQAEDLEDRGVDATTYQKRFKVFGTMGALLTVFSVSGAVWTSNTARARNKTTPELVKLKRRRNELLRYELSFEPLTRQLAVSGRF